MKFAALITALLVAISGCGLKGPLYLPDAPKPEQVPDDGNTTTSPQKKNRGNNSGTAPTTPAPDPPASTPPGG